MKGNLRSVPGLAFALVVICPLASAQSPGDVQRDALELLRPYDGTTASAAAHPVNRSTLAGKVVTGYQGWFTADGDGAGRGWFHYGRRGEFGPGRCSIDLWPNVSELGPEERYETPFRHADGRVAEVFSSFHRETVARHFRWMAEYGIDGAFVQRFAVETRHPLGLRQCNAVLASAREGANHYGRGYAVMYDLSGLPAGGVESVVEDWKRLVDEMRLGRDERDEAYFHHAGKPVVAVWGIGFNDGRGYSLAECDRLIKFLKSDTKYGGNTVLVGVPTGWRTLDRDAIKDAKLLDTILGADIVSPWTVGRYATTDDAHRHAQRDWKADLAWCDAHDKDYLPVVFPGFSWHNMRPSSPLNQIPRLGGKFLWKQFTAAKDFGAKMVYVAMFDEMDEGTAIFKCTNDVPVGESPFATFEGLPSDHYLWLTGQGGKLMRGEIKPTAELPRRDR